MVRTVLILGDQLSLESTALDGVTPAEPGCCSSRVVHYCEVDVEIVRAQIDEFAPHAFGADWNGLWPTSRAEAEQRLDRVIRDVLPLFGPHEDAMHALRDGLFGRRNHTISRRPTRSSGCGQRG